jgi:ketosteroid isomerase-like protein
MGAEEVGLARMAYAAFNRGDVEGALQRMDPEIEWRMSDLFSRGARVFHGHDGVREVLALFNESLDDFRAEPLEVLDAGEAVVAPVTVSGRLRGSGEPVSYELVQVWTMRGQRAIRLDVYRDLDEAWAALGMTPPARSSDSISDAGTGRENR